MIASQLEELEVNIKHIIDEILKQKRQYINKHIQNALNNYFLENYCTNELKSCFGIQSGRQIKKLIFQKYNQKKQYQQINLSFSQQQQSSLKKYYILLLGFLEEHLQNGTIELYRKNLIKITQEESIILNPSSQKIWQAQQWKKLLAIFVLHHTFFPQIEAVYEVWFDIFQSRIVEAKDQKKKLKERHHFPKFSQIPYIKGGIENSEEEQKQPPKSRDKFVEQTPQKLCQIKQILIKQESRNNKVIMLDGEQNIIENLQKVEDISENERIQLENIQSAITKQQSDQSQTELLMQKVIVEKIEENTNQAEGFPTILKLKTQQCNCLVDTTLINNEIPFNNYPYENINTNNHISSSQSFNAPILPLYFPYQSNSFPQGIPFHLSESLQNQYPNSQQVYIPYQIIYFPMHIQ